MGSLLLLRHAKSDWDEPGLDDHDRPLSPRGERAAAAGGVYLAQRGVEPTLVLCSSARRTRETLAHVRRQLGCEPRVRVERDLYLASPGSLLGRLQAVDDAEPCVLLIGHNPGLAALATTLARDGDAEALARMRTRFPTAALAEIALDGTRWRDLRPSAGRLVAFTVPKDLV